MHGLAMKVHGFDPRSSTGHAPAVVSNFPWTIPIPHSGPGYGSFTKAMTKTNACPIQPSVASSLGLGTHHASLEVANLERSLGVYRDVFGMRPVAAFGPPERRMVLLDVGDGTHLELSCPLPPSSPSVSADSPWKHLALRTSDTRGAIERARAAGLKVTIEPKRVNLGTIEALIAFFAGPDGESVELFEILPASQ